MTGDELAAATQRNAAAAVINVVAGFNKPLSPIATPFIAQALGADAAASDEAVESE